MKKLMFFLGGIVLLGSISCSKSNERAENSEAIQSFQNLEKSTDQRMAFSLLTVNEKVELAKDHIDFCISYFNLTSTQVGILQNTKLKLRDIYSSSDPENDPNAIQLALDIQQYFSNLSDRDGQIIFDSMVTDDEGVNEMVTHNPDKVTTCTCSSKSNWCSSSPYGPRITCDKTACNELTNSGCGTLWGYACNGKCNIFA